MCLSACNVSCVCDIVWCVCVVCVASGVCFGEFRFFCCGFCCVVCVFMKCLCVV
jgi:hypothetical protein